MPRLVQLLQNRLLKSRWLKWTVMCVALFYVWLKVDVHELLAAFAQFSHRTCLVAICLVLLSLIVGAWRWLMLLLAYGAQRPPPFSWLILAYWRALFFNTFLPGNVAGDVMRGWLTRSAFGEEDDGVATRTRHAKGGSRGGMQALTVVVQERVYGLLALLILTLVCLPLSHLTLFLPTAPLIATATFVAVVAIVSPALLRRVPTKVPFRSIRGLLQQIPALSRPLPLVFALVLSIGSQLIAALLGHCFVLELAPQVSALTSLTLMPLIVLAAYAPFTVAGLGMREVAFVTAYGYVGVSASDATAASLAYLAAQAAVALVGGAVPSPSPEQGPPTRSEVRRAP